MFTIWENVCTVMKFLAHNKFAHRTDWCTCNWLACSSHTSCGDSLNVSRDYSHFWRRVSISWRSSLQYFSPQPPVSSEVSVPVDSNPEILYLWSKSSKLEVVDKTGSIYEWKVWTVEMIHACLHLPLPTRDLVLHQFELRARTKFMGILFCISLNWEQEQSFWDRNFAVDS